MTHKLLLTHLGQAKLAAAATDGKGVVISEFAVGQGIDVDFANRLDKQTLVSKRYQAEVESVSGSSQANQYVVHCKIPIDRGGFTVREVALIDADGDLIWVGTLPEVQLPPSDSLSAVDYRLNFPIQIDNPDVTLVVDANVVTATRSWVEEHYIPRTALELMFPHGYAYWTHINQNPKPLFDALFGYETFWRRLEGVHLVAVQDDDAYINQPMQLLGQKGNTSPAINTRPHVYPIYSNYLFERYDPDTVIETIWKVTANKQTIDEGNSVVFTVSANNIPDGLILNYSIEEGDGTTSDNSDSGTTILNNGRANISYTTTADDNIEDPNKSVVLTIGTPANLSLNIPINDNGYNETVVHISQSTHEGIVLDEYFKAQSGSYPSATDTVRFIVDEGVDIIASDTSTGAIETGSKWVDGSEIILENHGRILGRGGDGGNGAYIDSDIYSNAHKPSVTARAPSTKGENGGTSIISTYSLTVENHALIAGGGGGGGGGAAYAYADVLDDTYPGITPSRIVQTQRSGTSSGGGAPLGKRSMTAGHTTWFAHQFNEPYRSQIISKLESINPDRVNCRKVDNQLEITFIVGAVITTSDTKIQIPFDELDTSIFKDLTDIPGFSSQILASAADSKLVNQFSDFINANPARVFFGVIFSSYYESWDEWYTSPGLLATNATVELHGEGGFGPGTNPYFRNTLDLQARNSRDLSNNRGGDGGDFGESGKPGILDRIDLGDGNNNASNWMYSDSLPTDTTKFKLESASEGGKAGYIYEGNVTIKNMNNGTTKGRIPG